MSEALVLFHDLILLSSDVAVLFYVFRLSRYLEFLRCMDICRYMLKNISHSPPVHELYNTSTRQISDHALYTDPSLIFIDI
ncbi:hypothetical protein HZ326_4773 [Fusarium oxysporum f. sp. albedinis]|nr:hypothetical protein HZ326_4773 [Fusarium oxysporum f. sp. albedinis]